MIKILGLDLGTNSIGWAVVNAQNVIINNVKELKLCGIEALGSRIIPMDAATLGDFEKGNTKSSTKERTSFRGTRRLIERRLLRRERLHRVLNVMGFLPEHYASQIGWDKNNNKTFGKFINNLEPKLAWKETENNGRAFIFTDSFSQMLADFAVLQPNLVANGKKVPYDWTIYYLRKKALVQAISKEELAWILLSFNQKRGYYQLRGDEEEENENKNKLVEYHELKVIDVKQIADRKGANTWYNVYLENEWIYQRTSRDYPDWIGKTKEFIVTTYINEDGSYKVDKDGTVKRSFREPNEDDWSLIKKKTEFNIEKSKKTIGAYIYDTILKNPDEKIRGKLIRTIERKYYREELTLILNKQKEFIPELNDANLYKECINELYDKNEARKQDISDRDFTYLFINDIIFYQRPLKSKKSLISGCSYESRKFYRVDKDGNNKLIEQAVKCIPKSHPLFQEFRLWQFINNLRIYEVDTDNDVTNIFLKNEDDYAALLEWLNKQKEIDQKNCLKYPAFALKKDINKYRWNYVTDKSYPCNETRALLLSRLNKIGVNEDFLLEIKQKDSKDETLSSLTNEERLWHILYSISDRTELEKALCKFGKEFNLPDGFVDAFIKFPPFKKDYGSYSASAIKKLLSLMRQGKYWKEEFVGKELRDRIDKIISGEYDANIRDRVMEKAINLTHISHFKALPLWLACYIVYNRHSEVKEITKWNVPEDIDIYLRNFKQHSLRNPIVEQVVTETLRTVRDIWKQVGTIDEIHIELGRDMKNPADKRREMTKRISDNESANLRIKRLLMEFLNPEFEIDGVRPYSQSQQDILHIYEDEVLNSVDILPEDIELLLKKFRESDIKKQPTKSEIMKYKLWLEQKYRSPYTGEIIPLGKLFTPMYEREHIIPQSRYFDDSFTNKVICESEINKLKNNQLAYEFIKNHHGEKVRISMGKEVEVFSVEDYEKFVRDRYSKLKTKRDKLLMDDIPDKFIERQLNDSRYISKFIKGLLSNIVRAKVGNDDYEQEAVSKNLISCSGVITDKLKKDWGMNDVWNNIVYQRFERLNSITKTSNFGQWDNRGGHKFFQTQMPIELQRGFNKKRIDHRHHAMDAVVIACATRSHVNYLNNEAAKSKYNNRQQLANKLKDKDSKCFIKPWETFTQDTNAALEDIIVSFKQNLRVINKTCNTYVKINDDGKKVLEKQVKGDNWAIRKPMHKDTVFGSVNLRQIKEVSLADAINTPMLIVDKELKRKIKELLANGLNLKKIKDYFNKEKDIWSEINTSKIKVYYFTDDTKDQLVAVRKPLDTSFTAKKISEKVTDTAIQRILLAHLEKNNNDPELAFSKDGIDRMNLNIQELNNGVPHKAIFKVRLSETKGLKFAVGKLGNKNTKFVETADGTNLFFAIYEKEVLDNKTGLISKIRTYATIPLNIVIDRQKQGLNPISEVNENGDKLLFYLSPNDLVYMPTKEELSKGILNIDKTRIYKVVSFYEKNLYFIPFAVSKVIFKGKEYLSNNKIELDDFNNSIKEVCIPIKVDRLGNIIKL